jgi:hypothetical protein
VGVAALWTGRAACAVSLVLSMAFSVIAEAGPPQDDGPLPRIGGPSTESRVDPLLSTVAGDLAGRPAEVRCWSREDWKKRGAEFAAELRTVHNRTVARDWQLLGFVSRDRRRLNLPAGTCSLLDVYRWWPDSARTRWYLAGAVQVFSHELVHLRGERSEVKAECWGLQSTRRVARRVGFAPEDADALAAYAWKELYRRERAKRSDECRNGGNLDLAPASPRWP